jgi:hypothetical protein
MSQIEETRRSPALVVFAAPAIGAYLIKWVIARNARRQGVPALLYQAITKTPAASMVIPVFSTSLKAISLPVDVPVRLFRMRRHAKASVERTAR